jgi:hypothetical protein
MKPLCIAVIFLLLFSCSQPADHSAALLPQQLHGQWRNIYMKLEMDSYKGTDSLKVLEVDERSWESVMKIRPIRTYFWYDGTYNSAHYDLHDSLFYNPAGRWKLVGDSITMVDTFPKPGLTYRYKVALKGDILEFTGKEDLDGDGSADDHYYGTQRRFR